MIVVDGRTDEEKLFELLSSGAEETALDFKASLDLSGKASKDSVEFAKDAISMGNLPSGGRAARSRATSKHLCTW